MNTKDRLRKVITLRNVRGSELPPEWAQRAGVDREQVVNIDITPVSTVKKRASFDEAMRWVEKIRSRVDTDKFLSDDDLYDAQGLPK